MKWNERKQLVIKIHALPLPPPPPRVHQIIIIIRTSSVVGFDGESGMVPTGSFFFLLWTTDAFATTCGLPILPKKYQIIALESLLFDKDVYLFWCYAHAPANARTNDFRSSVRPFELSQVQVEPSREFGLAVISHEELKAIKTPLMKIDCFAESLTNYKLYNFHLKSSVIRETHDADPSGIEWPVASADADAALRRCYKQKKYRLIGMCSRMADSHRDRDSNSAQIFAIVFIVASSRGSFPSLDAFVVGFFCRKLNLCFCPHDNEENRECHAWIQIKKRKTKQSNSFGAIPSHRQTLSIWRTISSADCFVFVFVLRNRRRVSRVFHTNQTFARSLHFYLILIDFFSRRKWSRKLYFRCRYTRQYRLGKA